MNSLSSKRILVYCFISLFSLICLPAVSAELTFSQTQKHTESLHEKWDINLVADSENHTLHYVWRGADSVGNSQIWTGSLDQNSQMWTASQKTTNIYYKDAPELTLDPQGNKLHYVWLELDSNQYYQVKGGSMYTNGSGWSSLSHSSSSSNKWSPQLVFDQNNCKIHYSWDKSDNTTNHQIWVSSKNCNGSGFTSAQYTSYAANSYSPRIAWDSNLDQLYYSWFKHTADGNLQIVFAARKTSQSGWSEKNLRSNSFHKDNLSIVCDSTSGKIYFSWIEMDAEHNPQIWIGIMNTDGSAWQAYKKTTSAFAKDSLSLLFDPIHESLIASWIQEDADGLPQIWTADLSTEVTGWNAQQQTDSLYTKDSVSMALDTVQGTIHFVWSEKDETGYPQICTAQATLLDTNPPNFTSIEIENLSNTSATIHCVTNEPTTAVLHYGISESYGISLYSDNVSKNHTFQLNNLVQESLYHFKIMITDTSENENTSSDKTFTTPFYDSETFTSLSLKASDWFIYDPAGTIINEEDPDFGASILRTQSNEGWQFGAAYTGSNGFNGNGIAITNKKYLSLWTKIQPAKDFTLFINVLDQNGKEYYLTYAPDNRQYGGMYLCFNTGKINDGTWQWLFRDLDQDLYKKTNTHLGMIRWICVRGEIRLGEISLFSEYPAQILIDSPANGSVVSEQPVSVTGTSNIAIDKVTINGVKAESNGTTFTMENCPLSKGTNHLSVQAFRIFDGKKLTVGYTNSTVIFQPDNEDPGEGLPLDGWFVYDAGGTLEKIYDTTLQKEILKMNATEGWGFGIAYSGSGSFSHPGLDISGKTDFSMTLKIENNKDFTVFINVLGTDGKEYYLTYAPDNRQYGNMYVCHNIGKINTGNWQIIERNLNTDLFVKKGINVSLIRWVCIRGNVSIGNVIFTEN